MRAAYWAAYQTEIERLDARQCKTGYGCGSSCISLAKDCQKTPKAATGKERLRRISQLAGGEIGEGKGLARLRQTEAAAKLEELQGERQSLAKAKRVVREIRQRRNQEATQQQTVRTPDRDRDTAAANIPMSGKRGRDLDREIDRNVRAQKAEKQAADRERGRQRREAQKQALELRKQHEKEFIDELAQKMDKPRKEVQGAFRSLTYQQQVQAIEKWVKEKGQQPTTQEPKQPGRQPAASQASEARDKEQNDLQVVKKRLKRAQGQLTEAQKLYKLYGSESQKQRVEQLQKAVESYKRVLSPEYRLNRGQTVEEISRTAGGGRYSTNPKQTAAEKAANTRLAKQQRLNELGRKLTERGLTTAEKAEYESLQPKRRRRTDSIYQSVYKSELQALRRRVA